MMCRHYLKKPFLVFIALVSLATAKSQPVSNPGMHELENKVIPWSRILPPVGNAIGKSTRIQGRNYSAYRIALIDSFTNWIKKSYIPVGGVPEPERLALPDSKNNDEYFPYGTGVSMGLWGPCYDVTGKKIIKSQPATVSRITILTNHIKGLEEAIFYNSPTQTYFTMSYDTKGNLVNEEDRQKNAGRFAELKSLTGNYLCYFTGRLCNIILSPVQELPVVPVSIGEVLDKGEEAADRAYPDKTGSMNTSIKENIRKLRDKYRSRLQEPAYINHSQLSVYDFSSDYNDLFQKQTSTRTMLPVYKFSPTYYELSKLDKPQLVHISFPYATEKSETVDLEIFRAMTRNFNYQYVYDYFFNPEKVKGKSYQPRQEVSQTAAIEKAETKDKNTKESKIYPEGIHFMEDFSDAVSGRMPTGWTSIENNRGFTIESKSNETGKWLLLDGGSNITPSAMKKPLPPGFTLEFDLRCTDFTNRTGRTVTLKISGNVNTVNLFFTPGNAENLAIYPSMAITRVELPPFKITSHDIEFSSYSNKNNKAHIKIVKSGTTIIAFVNGTKVESDPKYKRDYLKEMQLSDKNSFTKLEWSTDAVVPGVDKGNVYISNIIITKQ